MNGDDTSPALGHYEEELAELRHSYAAACAADIESLKLAIASTAEASIIGVGSGGSFTVTCATKTVQKTTSPSPAACEF